ncbi:hypothetical protein TKK_0011118 [Trichogramma kaykai]|uniref:Fanconi-associated nuclease n=1 Tax=Trichogramma kaykai TaxID=54128 RepID=A0ABD2WTA7_9HYME
MSVRTKQTTLDQFYRIVSNRNTGCGIKFYDSTSKNKGRKQRISLRRKSIMYPVVESEVKIVFDSTLKKKLKLSLNKKKRSSSSQTENVIKKPRHDSETFDATENVPAVQKSCTFESSQEVIASGAKENQIPCQYEATQPSIKTQLDDMIGIEKTMHENEAIYPYKLEPSQHFDDTGLFDDASNVDTSAPCTMPVKESAELQLKVSTPNENSDISKENLVSCKMESSEHYIDDYEFDNLDCANDKEPAVDSKAFIKVKSPSQINLTMGNIEEVKTSPSKTPFKKKSKVSPKKNSPQKLYFVDRVNMDDVRAAVENLNLVRQGCINSNEFDLESIYKKSDFSIVYSDVINTNCVKFDIRDINFGQEKHADHLMSIVMNVFSNPMNCGYFSIDELNLVFSLFTLSKESQMLFVRLLKRKLGWHRASLIKYPEISDNLVPFFKELVDNGFCSSDLEKVDMPDILNMLQADEVKTICQKFKINNKGTKPVLIGRLLKYGNSAKSLFVGAKSPKTVLRSTVQITLKLCVCMETNVTEIFNRILLLFHPTQDPKESIADLFLLLTNVHKGEVLYPIRPKGEQFPIFKNQQSLKEYVEANNAVRETYASTEKKDWENIKKLGRTALDHIKNSKLRPENSTLPLHVRKFVAEYSWLKVMSMSVDAFKKSPETIPEAVTILKTLIDDKLFSQSSRGKWYSELALIEMHHLKNLENSAALAIHALQQNTLTEVDVSDLVDRLRKLTRRKTGLSKETRELVEKTLLDVEEKGLVPQPANTKIIKANMANRAESTGKSTWSITINGRDKFYGSVEVLALQHYTSEEMFVEGLHCEGALPITLFTIFFWDELYSYYVPGTFISDYQSAPLDLFTKEFFQNRKEAIEEKLTSMRAMDSDTFAMILYDKYCSCLQYQSLMANNPLFKNEDQFKEVVLCLGVSGVTGICERLVTNYRLWRSGFPDIIVWNVVNSTCKIVEVKGPGDSLSQKQKLWLQYLEQIGLDVEVCHVEALGRGSK